MNKNERLIFFYDLMITASSRTFDAPQSISVKKAIELMNSVALDDMNKAIDNNACMLYISSWKYTHSNDQVRILVNRSDKNIPDPIFSDHKTKTRRIVNKEVAEGQDYSAHIIIQLPTNDRDPALLLIEQNKGLSISNIKKLFDSILLEAKKIEENKSTFIQKHPNGAVNSKNEPITYNVSFKTDFLGHISNDLKRDLERGTINSVEVITDIEQNESFDEDSYLSEKKNVLHLGIKEENLSNQSKILGKLKSIIKDIKQKKPNFDQAKIKFKTPSGINRTITIDRDQLDTEYVRKEKITDFSTDLLSSYNHINDEIINKMADFIPKEG